MFIAWDISNQFMDNWGNSPEDYRRSADFFNWTH